MVRSFLVVSIDQVLNPIQILYPSVKPYADESQDVYGYIPRIDNSPFSSPSFILWMDGDFLPEFFLVPSHKLMTIAVRSFMEFPFFHCCYFHSEYWRTRYTSPKDSFCYCRCCSKQTLVPLSSARFCISW